MSSRNVSADRLLAAGGLPAALGAQHKLGLWGSSLRQRLVLSAIVLVLTSLVPALAQGAAAPAANAVAEEPELALDEQTRTYLWETEHRGTLLQANEMRRLVEALREADASGLRAALAQGFTGSLAAQLNPIRAKTAYADVSRSQHSGKKRQRLDREGFTTWLLNQRKKFSGTPDVKAAVSVIHPAKRKVIDGIWVGKVQLRLWGNSTKGELLELGLYFYLEFNAPDVDKREVQGWLRRCDVLQIKEARAASPLMADVTERTGIDHRSLHDNWLHGPDETYGVTGGVYATDFNRDGRVDLLINDFTTTSGYALYQGLEGGRFTNVTRQVGLPPARGVMLVSFVDLDGDGWEDLILGPGAIFRNERGQRFSNVSAESNLRQLGRLDDTQALSGLVPADFDRDGRMDLYLFRSTSRPREGSWINGKIGDDQENQLLRNVGGWKFEDVTEASGTAGGRRSTFTAVWLDANNDNWPDLYVINEFGNGVLLANAGDGTFQEHAIVDGPSDFGSMGLTCGDMNNDGRVDLYVASMYSKSGSRVIANLPEDAHAEDVMAQLRRMVAGSQLYRNDGDFQFERVGPDWQVAAVGWAYGPSMVDLDNDGWLDIYAPTGFISRDRTRPDG